VAKPLNGQAIGDSEEIGFSIKLRDVSLSELPPIHSYAYGKNGNDILIVGGRIDGLHARQPFAAFPLASNNQQLIVVNPVERRVWTANLSGFPVGIREQFQSTNMNFYQSADTLYLIGGYAFSQTANNHITFPNLTTVIVSQLIESIKSGAPQVDAVRQITDDRFANSGGQIGMLDGSLLLIGGNKFTGRYNPVGNPTYTQEYLPKIQYFRIDNSSESPQIISYSVVTDEDHLRRRDYNLVPYSFQDGRPGYLISSGVFRPDALLPYLHPVEIDVDNYYPHPDTEQLLSNYHSPKVSLIDETNQIHMIFFGGLAQYYYDNGELIRDDRVPFVNTVSRFTRNSDGTFSESIMPLSMPYLNSTNAEFVPNKQLSRNETGVFKLSDLNGSTDYVLGHIIGGIRSDELNPFVANRTQYTYASSTMYEVIINKTTGTSIEVERPTRLVLNQNYPNPFNPSTNISFHLPENSMVKLEIFDVLGKHVITLVDGVMAAGYNMVPFEAASLTSGIYIYRLTAGDITLSRHMLLLK